MSGPRRFLIATAVSHYPHAPEWDRPGLVEARRKVVDLFTGPLGYEHVSDLGANPTQQQLLRELREFCRAPDRRPDDILAVYIAGHGERLDDEEYVLLTSDTHPDDLYDALQPAQLARKILAGTKVRRLLLMLDTCYSGQGGNELLASMARLKSGWREKDAGLAVITSAQPNELARTGAFPELLAEAVTSLATAGYTPELLPLDAVVKATASSPSKPDFQHIGLEIIGLTGAIPPFLPNAKHSPRLSHTDMALQQAAEWEEQDKRRDVEFRTRLLRRAMGHSDTRHVGWWFSGRRRALEHLTDWLRELPDERPALVVTADPGSGKTAVLGLLAALSDPEYRRTVPLAPLGLTGVPLPPPEAIRTAVYAQNLTDQQVVRALAAALRLPPAESVADLLNQLNSQAEPDRPQVVLIDGLDEAATPSSLCTQVLRPLSELACARLRLLLGTRPHLLVPLGQHRRDHIDLDSPRYADPDAVRAYAVRNLIDAHPDSPYLEGERRTLLGVADAVAEAAGHSFLVARITAGTLAAAPAPPADPWDPQWRRSLPRAAAEAMQEDLHKRFGKGARRILDLLRPLAHAEGQGLPWEDVWAPLASQLSGRRYTDDDLLELRRDAGAYVVEAAEDGRSVYRLYHESMAEYLRQGWDAGATHAGFTEVLRRAVPYELDGARDWSRAHPYALRHLAVHAATAGLLDSLLTDLDYLVHADCDTLAPLLSQAEGDTARLHAAIYLVSLHVHHGLDTAGRRQVLALNAARFNDPEALETLNTRAAERAWKPIAATGFQVSADVRHVCAGHNGIVNAVACTELNGRPVAVSASWDRTLRIWDLTTGRPVGEPLIGHSGHVLSLVCTHVDGRPVAVSSSWDRTLRIWDLTTGRLVGEPLTGHTNSVDVVACSELDGRPIALSGSADETLRIWDLATAQLVGRPVNVNGRVEAVACTEVGNRPVAVVSSGWRLEFWDLKTRERLHQEDFHARALSASTRNGRPVVVGYANNGAVRVWDPSTFEVLAEWSGLPDAPTSVACTELDGRSVAIVGYHDATVRIWDLNAHERVISLLQGHGSGVLTVAHSSLDGQPVAVTGSFDGTVRIWDLSSRRSAGRPVAGHTDRVTGMDLAVVDGRPIFVTTSQDNTLRVWDRATVMPLGAAMDHTGFDAVACTMLGGHPVAVSIGGGRARAHDLVTGLILYPPQKIAFHLVDLACTVLDDRPIAVAASMKNTMRVWDVETGEPLYEPTEEHTEWAESVTCTVLDGRPVAAATSHQDTLRIWDLATGRSVGSMPGREGPVACTMLDDRPVVASLLDWMTIQLRDLRTGDPIGRPMTTGTGYVAALVCAQLDGRPIAVTSFLDNTIRIWDLRTTSLTDTIHLPGPCEALALDESGLLICAFGSDIGTFSRD